LLNVAAANAQQNDSQSSDAGLSHRHTGFSGSEKNRVKRSYCYDRKIAIAAVSSPAVKIAIKCEIQAKSPSLTLAMIETGSCDASIRSDQAGAVTSASNTRTFFHIGLHSSMNCLCREATW
jgi:hypothetical protein